MYMQIISSSGDLHLLFVHVEGDPLCATFEIKRLPADGIDFIPARVLLGQMQYQCTTLRSQEKLAAS
jgi:hypothetical protein